MILGDDAHEHATGYAAIGSSCGGEPPPFCRERNASNAPRPAAYREGMAEIIPLHPPRGPAPEPLWRELLGEQIRQRRHERGERLVETAERAGISPQYLSEIERGLKDASSEMIAAVAGALDTSVIEFASDIAEELRATGLPNELTQVGGEAFLLAA